MVEREKLIRAMEYCTADITPVDENDECLGDVCPFKEGGYESGDCQENMIRAALALLREQEPRVLDWNEIGTVDGAVWLEDRDENEVVPGLVMQMHSAVNLDIKKDGKLHTASASRSDYGEGWRAWSARPTEEQRKAVLWDG